MTEESSFFQVEPEGPLSIGLQEWETMDPKSLVSGNPIQRGHIHHEYPNIGYMTGVWDCTGFVEQMGPYQVDEYMLFLEGELFLDLPDGKTGNGIDKKALEHSGHLERSLLGAGKGLITTIRNA